MEFALFVCDAGVHAVSTLKEAEKPVDTLDRSSWTLQDIGHILAQSYIM